jgi:hypothetical protein
LADEQACALESLRPDLNSARGELRGRWTLRYLTAFLETTDADVLIKIDPDTAVLRAAKRYQTQICLVSM